MARFLRGACTVGLTAASWCGAGARGRAWPAARRGRHRTKAERADRQRRESRGRIAPARQARPLSSRSNPLRDSAPKTTRATRRAARSARP